MRHAAPVLVSLCALLLGACASLYGVTDVPDAGDTGAGADGGTDSPSGRDSTTPANDGGGEDHHSPDAHDATSNDGHVGDAHDAGTDAVDGAASDATHEAAIDASSVSLSVTPSTLSFTNTGGTPGFVSCGTTPETLTFTVKNPATRSAEWWASFGLGAASPYMQSEATCTQSAPCTIAGGASVVVTVTAPPVSADAGIATFNDTITVFSNATADGGQAGQQQGQVVLQEASYGAVLTFSPTDVNFGQQPNNNTYSQGVQILNAGNAMVTGATLGRNGSTEFSLSTGSTAFEIPVSGTSFTAMFDPAGDTTAVNGAVSLTVPPNSTCAPLPSALTLEGQGTSALISVTSSLNFNTGLNGGIGVSCGATAATQPVKVKNTGTGAATITALTLGMGASSPYTVSTSGLPIAVPAGMTVNVPVVPNKVPTTSAPGATLNDTLGITIGGTTYNVALQETAAGAVLSLATTTIAFSATPSGQKATYGQVLTNSGNVAAPVTFSANKTVFTFDTNVVASVDANTSVNAYFSPTTATGYSATGSLVVASGTPLCAGSSGTIPLTLTGTGTNSNSYAVTPSAIAFGTNTCGSSPPAAQTVTITDNAFLDSTSWTAVLGGANPTLFTLSASSGSVTNLGGAVTFTVRPTELSSSSNLTANEVAYGVDAIVTVTVGTGTGAETFTIPVSELPSGVCGQ